VLVPRVAGGTDLLHEAVGRGAFAQHQLQLVALLLQQKEELAGADLDDAKGVERGAALGLP